MRRVIVRLVALSASLALLPSGSTLKAQSIVRVLDRDSVPVPFAMVTVTGSPARATDSTGRVRLSGGQGGVTRFAVRRIGYAPFAGEVEPGADGQYVVLLAAARPRLDTVRAIAPRETPLSRTGFYDRMARVRNGAITGWFISPEELDDRQIMQVSRALQGVGSVRVSRTRDGHAVIGGRGGCGMTILLDGIRLNRVLGQESSTEAPVSISGSMMGMSASKDHRPIDELVEGGAVMAIEIYPSLANAPAELIPLSGGGGCGIIALWTGPRR